MAKRFLHKMGLQRKKKPVGGLELDLSSSLDERQLTWRNTNSDSGMSFASQQSQDSPLVTGMISRNGSSRTTSRCSEYSVGSSNAEPPVSLCSVSDGEQGKESHAHKSLPQQLSVPSVHPTPSMLVRMNEVDVVTGEESSASPQRRRDVGTGNSLLRTKEKVWREREGAVYSCVCAGGGGERDSIRVILHACFTSFQCIAWCIYVHTCKESCQCITYVHP